MDDAELVRTAEAVPGFMPPEEGLALHAVAAEYAPVGPILEIGTYCGKSTIYLATAARDCGQLVITLDHHRGSEEHQPGWEYHDATLAEPRTGRIDTLPRFRAAIAAAGLEDAVVAIVGRSADVARLWRTPLGLVFIDGGHTDEAARADYAGWSPWVRRERSPSTTSSRTRPTAARPRTGTTGRRWKPAASWRSGSPGSLPVLECTGSVAG